MLLQGKCTVQRCCWQTLLHKSAMIYFSSVKTRFIFNLVKMERVQCQQNTSWLCCEYRLVAVDKNVANLDSGQKTGKFNFEIV